MQELGLAPFPFSFIVSLMWVGIFMLAGILLRGFIPFCRKYLVPSCMVGGIVAFLFMNFVPLEFLGFMQPNGKDMEVLVYHMFNLSFVCFGLSGFGSGSSGATPWSIIKTATWLGGTTAVAGGIQVLIGIGIIAGYNMLLGTSLLESAGYLASQGFITGPGAAMSAGAVFEQAGHSGMMSLGLAFAAMGYVFSIICGVPAANYVLRKTGRIQAGQVPEDEQYGIYKAGQEAEAGKLRFMSSNVDSMTYQMCLILLTYGLAFMVVMLIRKTGLLGPQGMAILWSMLAFLFCMPMGVLVRSILNRTAAGHLFDMGCHTRLLNILIDLMALTALGGISIHVLREWLVLMVIISTALALGTAFILWYTCRYLKEYAGERFLVVLGTATGTVTSGLVLVRMLDPEFKSPVPLEIGLLALPSMAIALPLMPITMPATYAQAFGGSIWPFIGITAVICVIWLIVLKMPFWHLTDKTAKF